MTSQSAEDSITTDDRGVFFLPASGSKAVYNNLIVLLTKGKFFISQRQEANAADGKALKQPEAEGVYGKRCLNFINKFGKRQTQKVRRRN